MQIVEIGNRRSSKGAEMDLFLTGLALTAFVTLCVGWSTFPYDESREIERDPRARGLSAL